MARLLAVLMLLLSGCMFLTRFEPEGQPCDLSAAPSMQCLQGYHCEMQKCVKGDFDGGK